MLQTTVTLHIKVTFKLIWKINMLFHCRDAVGKRIGSDLAYCNTCVNFKTTYHGKRYCLSFTRVGVFIAFLKWWGNLSKMSNNELYLITCWDITVPLICLNKSSLKWWKMIFKAFFLLMILNFLSWHFGHVEKMTWLEM